MDINRAMHRPWTPPIISRTRLLRERTVVEHVFVGEALRALWCRGVVDVEESLRSEFDAYGYDLVMARGDIVRHIQFKTGKSAKPGDISIALALTDKPSGCVLWIRVSDRLDLGPFFWFGRAPGKKLRPIGDYKSPMRPTRNKLGERPLRKNHRLISGDEFDRFEQMDDVLEARRISGVCPERRRSCHEPARPHSLPDPARAARTHSRRRRAGRHPLPGIFRRDHPQPAHAPRLQPRGRGVSRMVRGGRRALDRAHRAAACSDLDRVADQARVRAEREAEARRHSPPV